MADAQGEDWTELFSHIVQKVINDLVDGKRNALSIFMEQESKRVLTAVPSLNAPGAL